MDDKVISAHLKVFHAFISGQKTCNKPGNSNRKACAGDCQKKCICGIDQIKIRCHLGTDHIQRYGKEYADQFAQDAGNAQDRYTFGNGFCFFRHQYLPFTGSVFMPCGASEQNEQGQ